jgi:carbon monoxide dehydrogenase subunit G
MKFENDFSVEAPIDEVFATLLDLDKVAPAMPGAQVTDHVGDDAYKVAIKVKLGPMTMNYKGDVDIREKDTDAHRALMHVKAREARGQGTATADVTMQLQEEGTGTHASVIAEVQLAGKAAAMGRGLIQDVSAKLVDQFADNLQAMLSNGSAESVAPPADDRVTDDRVTGTAQDAAPKAAPAAEADGLDAGALIGGMAAERLKDPRVLGGVIGLALLIGYLLGRRSG